MGKMRQSKKSARGKPAPSSLTLRLYAPGMTLLHRAGLGGLAATLQAMERRHKLGRLRDDQLPQGSDLGKGYPWQVKTASVTLHWGEPKAARDYLRKLFAFAFGIKDKLIDLPGTYRDELSRAVRAELQQGIETTFLTHAPTAGSRAGINRTNVAIEDVPFVIRHTVFTSYRHQGWYWLERDEKQEVLDSATGKKSKRKTGRKLRHRATLEVIDEDGTLAEGRFSVDKKVFPGAVVRHSGLAKSTAVVEGEHTLLCLYFALVGSLCLQGPRRMVHDRQAKRRVPKATGVLVVPEVADLLQFAHARPRMTPTSVRGCRIAGASDAVLQAVLRLKAKRLIGRHGFNAVYGVHLAPTDWASDQQSRVNTVYVRASPPRDGRALRRFELALGYLAARIRPKEVIHTTGRGKKRQELRQTQWFWADSLVRPLVADNLACGKRWYDGFARLIGNRDMTRKVSYETKGLQAMADEPELLDDEEMKFIRALHRAIAIGLGRIYDEMGRPPKGPNGRYPVGLTRRWDRFRERVRLALIGAKTRSQTQDAISVVLARAGIVSELRDAQALRQLKDLIFGDDWRRARDLALFALASYKKPADLKELPADTEGLEESEGETEPLPETEE